MLFYLFFCSKIKIKIACNRYIICDFLIKTQRFIKILSTFLQQLYKNRGIFPSPFDAASWKQHPSVEFFWQEEQNYIWATPIWLPLPWKVVHQNFSEWKNTIKPLKLNISAGHVEWWVNQTGRFYRHATPLNSHTHKWGKYTKTSCRRVTYTLNDRAVHWGSLCFLSVGGRDEVMINMGYVCKCKSVPQHK